MPTILHRRRRRSSARPTMPQPAETSMRASPTSTRCPARILQVLRSSTAPSTRTAPLATRALPAPPLSHRPASLSSWLSSTWSPSSWKSIGRIGSSLRVAGVGLLPRAHEAWMVAKPRPVRTEFDPGSSPRPGAAVTAGRARPRSCTAPGTGPSVDAPEHVAEARVAVQGVQVGVVLDPLAVAPAQRNGAFEQVERTVVLAQDGEGAGGVVEDDRFLARGLDRAFGPFDRAFPLAELGQVDRARSQCPAVVGIHLQVPFYVGHGGFQRLARGVGASHGEVGLPE